MPAVMIAKRSGKIAQTAAVKRIAHPVLAPAETSVVYAAEGKASHSPHRTPAPNVGTNNMRIHLLASLLLLMNPNVFAEDFECPIHIVPDKSIGPVRLGMTLKEVQAAKLPLVSGAFPPGHGRIGPVDYQMDPEGRIDQIMVRLADLPACVQLGSVFISPYQEKDALARAVGHCRLDVRLGGNVYQCQGFDVDDANGSPRLHLPSEINQHFTRPRSVTSPRSAADLPGSHVLPD